MREREKGGERERGRGGQGHTLCIIIPLLVSLSSSLLLQLVPLALVVFLTSLSLPPSHSFSLTHFSAIALLFPFFGFPFSPAFFPQPFTAPTCSVPRRGREGTGTNKRRKERKEQGGKECLSPHRTPFGISSSIPPELNNSNQQAKPHIFLPSYVMHAFRVKKQVTHACMTTRKKNSIG